uniref:CBF1-interacting co-repressor CIR N-terminal domain-containing protein n=1 Tax=Arcella intermedia TaxID=1963864 RepID=A0A6B2LMC9_9EUKA
MRHMEKVWKAEERAKQEERKMAELKQELSEEREMEELRKVHEQLTGQKKKERVDFLYSEPLLNGPSSDDYLLGAKYKSNGEDNDVKNVQSRPGSLWLDQPSLGSESLFDKRTKIREDPLFSIKKEEQHQKALLKNNPVLLNRLRQQLLKKKLKDQEKKEKKEKQEQ